MIMTSSSFVIRGRVGKNIKHIGSQVYPITFFNVGITTGREKDSSNYKWEAIPIVCNRNVSINTGDYVVVTGAVRMTKREEDKYPKISLFADSVALIEKKMEEPPKTPEDIYTGEKSSIQNTDYADADIPF